MSEAQHRDEDERDDRDEFSETVASCDECMTNVYEEVRKNEGRN